MRHIMIIGAGSILILVGAFFALNTYIYNEKQADPIPREEYEIGEESPKPSLPPEENQNQSTLTGKKWVWTETQYNDERIITPRTKGAFTLQFNADGSFGVTTDCNGVGGNYELTSTGIVFQDMISTLMYCEGSQENEFRTMLEHSTGYSFGSDGSLILDLKFDSGSVVFR